MADSRDRGLLNTLAGLLGGVLGTLKGVEDVALAPPPSRPHDLRETERAAEPRADSGRSEGHEPRGQVHLRPGWSIPVPEEIPQPTYMPVVVALGVTLAFMGVATSGILSCVGFLLILGGLIGWMEEMIHGEH